VGTLINCSFNIVSSEEVAWAAGFFDGEGTTGTYRDGSTTTKRCRIQISASQNDREVLDRFAMIVGVGKVGGPYDNVKSSKIRRLA
jgi:hypothetical protein